MAEIILVISTLFCFVFLVAGVLHIWQRRMIRIEERINTYLLHDETGFGAQSDEGEGTNRGSTIVGRLVSFLRQYIASKMSKHGSKELEHRLRDAGYPFNLTPIDFRLVQLGLIVLLGGLSFLLFHQSSPSMGQLLILTFACGSLGYVYPNFYLGAKKKKRVAQIEKGMPDFFDMVNLLMEAGMGLDAALAKVSKETGGPIAQEFFLAIKDMNLGKSRREAFSDLRDRVSSELFQSVMRQLIQADRLGIGMVNVLRAQTQRIREQRIQLAREKAMKVPVKMLLPMVFFIFPTLFIVILGPVVIQLVTNPPW